MNIVWKRNLSIVTLLFFLTTFLSFYPNNVDAEIFSSISGSVIDSKTGQGISEIEIFALLKSTNSQLIYFYTKTDIQGRYIFEKVTSGTYEIIIFPQIFPYVNIPQTSKIIVLRGRNVVGLDFSIARGGSISGAIYKSDRITPLSNTHILIYTSEGSYGETITDINGRYKVDQLLQSSLTSVRIMVDGFSDIVKEGIKIESEKITELADVIIPTDKIISITGMVKSSSNNNLIKEALVILKGERNNSFTITDTEGRYSIIGLPAGTYTLSGIGLGTSFFQTNVILSETESLQFDILLQPSTLVPEEVLKKLANPHVMVGVVVGVAGGIIGLTIGGGINLFCKGTCLGIKKYNDIVRIILECQRTGVPSPFKTPIPPPQWAYFVCEFCSSTPPF